MPLKLIRRAGSDNWYVRGKIRGIAIFESTQTDNRKRAEAYRKAREDEVYAATAPGQRGGTTTFLALAVGYMEAGGERRFMQPLIDHFGTTPMRKIDQIAVESAAAALYPGCSPATISRQVFTPVSAVASYGADRGLCDPLRLRRPKPPTGRVRWITPEEAQTLIDACPAWFAPLVTFLLYTGSRSGEALGLDWSDVDLRRKQVTFRDTKNGDTRGVPLHPAAYEALVSLPHREGRVFLSSENRPYREEDERGYIGSPFAAACRRAGIEDFHPHDCRHTWATWHYQANRNLLELMALGGWKTMSMVQRYAHVNVAHLAASIEALPRAKRVQSHRQKALEH